MTSNKTLLTLLVSVCTFLLLTSTTCYEVEDLYIYNGLDQPIWVGNAYYSDAYPLPPEGTEPQYQSDYFRKYPAKEFSIFGGFQLDEKKEVKKYTIVVTVIRDDVYRSTPFNEIIAGRMYDTDTISGSELMKSDFLVTYPFK